MSIVDVNSSFVFLQINLQRVLRCLSSARTHTYKMLMDAPMTRCSMHCQTFYRRCLWTYRSDVQ